MNRKSLPSIMRLAAIRRYFLLIAAIGVWESMAWGQEGSKIPMATECLVMQIQFLNKVTQGLDAEGRQKVETAAVSEFKSLANVALQPTPERIVSSIKLSLDLLHSRTYVDPRPDDFSFGTPKASLLAADVYLCWMDHYAMRPNSFPVHEKMQYIAQLQESNRKTVGAAEPFGALVEKLAKERRAREELLRRAQIEAYANKFRAEIGQMNAGQLYAKADEFSSIGEIEEARKVLRVLVSRFPDHPLAAQAAARLVGSGGSVSQGQTRNQFGGGANGARNSMADDPKVFGRSARSN